MTLALANQVLENMLGWKEAFPAFPPVSKSIPT
jgi:hypothetical protein